MVILNRIKIFGGNVLTLLFLGTILIIISYYLKSANEQTQRHTILSIDKVEKTSGNKDNFTTEVYYIVTTDKGIYHIETSGWNAHPECAGMKKDSTYLVTTRGFNFPFLGIYSNVIGYQRIKE